MLKSHVSIQADFDWQQLQQLAGEDADFETELLTMFLQDAKLSLSQLEGAIAQQDMLAIADIAHSLRGSSANVGAIALSRLASQLESIVNSGCHLTDAGALVQQLHGCCQRIQAYLTTS
ncbi:MAG: Hpt domain-containing protein [Phormidesmis sp. RL_2_1]|nr:Hpt domain-containing protein [Phormidesmis sp. RL_2_1]